MYKTGYVGLERFGLGPWVTLQWRETKIMALDKSQYNWLYTDSIYMYSTSKISSKPLLVSLLGIWSPINWYRNVFTSINEICYNETSYKPEGKFYPHVFLSR